MSRREKRNEKKGISLVGFLIILVALVCLEGIYIVKLKGGDNIETPNEELVSIPDTNNTPSKPEAPKESFESTNSLNEKIVLTAGYDFDKMIDAILDDVERQAENENIVKFVDNVATEEVVNSQEIKEKRDAYKIVIMNNLDSDSLINYVKFEKGNLSCEYNLKNLLNLIGLESASYAELGANENFVIVYKFN